MLLAISIKYLGLRSKQYQSLCKTKIQYEKWYKLFNKSMNLLIFLKKRKLVTSGHEFIT